jgi:hypothetical protein
VSSHEGAQQCIDLAPNDSIIPVLSGAPQVQQRTEENFVQTRVEMRENEANTGNWRTCVRHEENLPRITQTWDRREESPPGSAHESSLGSARASGVRGPHRDPADTDVSESSGGRRRTPSRETASARSGYLQRFGDRPVARSRLWVRTCARLLCPSIGG